jgi:rhodanese-related sulfurtransferase
LHELNRQCPVEIIDVRQPEEFDEVHAAPARNVPMDTIDPREFMKSRSGAADEPIYFICQVGGRSGWMCAAFLAAGYSNVVNVEGGTDAWIEAGLPIVR